MGVNLSVGFHRESFPEQIKKISIHKDGGGLANFVVLANSKLTGFTAVSYFFTLTRDEPKKSSHSLPLTLQFDHRDNGLGGGITFGSLVLTPGQLDLASGATDLLNTEGSYQKVNLDVVRLQATALNGLTVYGRASGQWADVNLDSSEGFSIGGMSGVRAYPSGEASGDTGWLAQLELRYQLGSLNPMCFTIWPRCGRMLNLRPAALTAVPICRAAVSVCVTA